MNGNDDRLLAMNHRCRQFPSWWPRRENIPSYSNGTSGRMRRFSTHLYRTIPRGHFDSQISAVPVTGSSWVGESFRLPLMQPVGALACTSRAGCQDAGGVAFTAPRRHRSLPRGFPLGLGFDQLHHRRVAASHAYSPARETSRRNRQVKTIGASLYGRWPKRNYVGKETFSPSHHFYPLG